ncbi:MAG: type II toxin-antitoxin system RelE/ParE family toxin [Candidatus Dadabacteria bacterium]|nr:type II toxin-antitoxin system RelE/ParE family toxin [Candidatus Dadabacteria bacterium]
MPFPKIVVGYKKKDGKSPFSDWLSKIDDNAARKVQRGISNMRQGNFSNAESVGQGVSEYKIHFGPGYRIYFGMDGENLVILLGGGTKKRQGRDIEMAKGLWREYKSRKKEGGIQWH